MAALFDTSVGVLLLRRRTPDAARHVLYAAHAEIKGGSALLPASAVTELLIGEPRPERSAELSTLLSKLPIAVLPTEAAAWAGSMGAFLSSAGAAIPFPDLLVAATAVWLDIPLLAWDGDYARSRKIALKSASSHSGVALWRTLRLHPASLDA